MAEIENYEINAITFISEEEIEMKKRKWGKKNDGNELNKCD